MLLGTETPVTLRRVNEARGEVSEEEDETLRRTFRDQCIRIGHAYVRGIMHGEALATMGKGGEVSYDRYEGTGPQGVLSSMGFGVSLEGGT